MNRNAILALALLGLAGTADAGNRGKGQGNGARNQQNAPSQQANRGNGQQDHVRGAQRGGNGHGAQRGQGHGAQRGQGHGAQRGGHGYGAQRGGNGHGAGHDMHRGHGQGHTSHGNGNGYGHSNHAQNHGRSGQIDRSGSAPNTHRPVHNSPNTRTSPNQQRGAAQGRPDTQTRQGSRGHTQTRHGDNFRMSRDTDQQWGQARQHNEAGESRQQSQGNQRTTTTIQSRDGRTWTSDQIQERREQGRRTMGGNGTPNREVRATMDDRRRDTATGPNGRSATREMHERGVSHRGGNGTETRGNSARDTQGRVSGDKPNRPVRPNVPTNRPGTQGHNGQGVDRPTSRPGTPTRNNDQDTRPGYDGDPSNGERPNNKPNQGRGNGHGHGHSGGSGGQGGSGDVIINNVNTNTNTVSASGGRQVVYSNGVRPYHGIFVYGPTPSTHHHYHYGNSNTVVKNRDMPTRFVDRSDTLALGLTAGSLMSGYENGESYGDLGLGLKGRYRPAESVGLELSVTHHDSAWAPESARSQTLGSASVALFAWPWTRVSPYAIGGLTVNNRQIADELASYQGVDQLDTGRNLIGAHGGLGLELAMGRSAALDLEARYVGWLNQQDTDLATPGALQATAGLVFHF